MTSKDQWHLDDEGRLHQAMRRMDRNKVEWHGLPAATTRGGKAADRLLNGIIVILHLAVAGIVGAFALSVLGYIDVPNKGQQSPVTVPAPARPELPAIGSDLCGR